MEKNTVIPVIDEENTNSSNAALLLATSILINAKILNINDHKLGNLKKLTIDIVRGEVMYGIIAYGNIWGIGGKLAAVPWRALTFNKKNQNFFLTSKI